MSTPSTHIIIMERDCDSPFDSEGPIVMEQYVNRRNDYEAIMARAQSLADGRKYGRIWIGEIVYDHLEEIVAAPPKEQDGTECPLCGEMFCPGDCEGKVDG